MSLDVPPAPLKPFRPRWSRLFLWLGTPSALGLLGLALEGLYLRHVAEATLAEAVAEADREGPGWRLEEIEAARGTLADDENGALQVGKAYDALPDDWKRPVPPKKGEVATRGPDLLASLPAGTPEVLLDEARAKLVAAEVERTAGAVALAREMVGFPDGRYPIDWQDDLFKTLLPGQQNSRQVARLLALDAVDRAQRGDVDGALASCRALLNVGRAIGDEPLAISQLVRMAIGSVAELAVERTLARGKPGEAELVAVQAAFASESYEPLLNYAAAGARAMLFQFFSNLDAGLISLDGGAKPGRVAPWDRVKYRYSQGIALGFMNRCVAIADRPPHEQPPRWAGWEADLAAGSKTRGARLTGGLDYRLLPAIPDVSRIYARDRALLGAIATLAAAERFRKLKGDWPGSASDIEAALETKLPADPYLPGPYRLGRFEGGLVVYSIGPDGLDDGGNLDNNKYERAGVDLGFRLWDVAGRRRAP